MEKINYQDPPPDWEEVILLWDDILRNGNDYPIREILDWLPDAPGGRYHIHGYKFDKGFCFRFENPADATYFKLKWL